MRIRILALLVMMVTTLFAQSLAPRPEQPSWIGSWAASIFEGDSKDGVPTLVDSTLREVVHTSVAGSQLRVRLSNEFGIEPLRIGVASIAASAGGSRVDPASIHDLTFGESPSIVIPPGAEVLSDPVPMATLAFENLAVNLYLPLQQISDVSVHPSAQQDNYVQTGNHVKAVLLTGPVVVPSWYFVKGVDVEPVAARQATVVAFGDSITDGAGATENANHRWPDYLALRLHNNPASSSISVLDEGISGNCVLKRCAGPNALAEAAQRDLLLEVAVPRRNPGLARHFQLFRSTHLQCRSNLSYARDWRNPCRCTHCAVRFQRAGAPHGD